MTEELKDPYTYVYFKSLFSFQFDHHCTLLLIVSCIFQESPSSHLHITATCNAYLRPCQRCLFGCAYSDGYDRLQRYCGGTVQLL